MTYEKCLLLLPTVFLLTACVSSGDQDGSEVLERSANFRPAWAQDDFSEEGDGPKQLHFRKTGVFRLELGIKQAQAAAIEQSCELIVARIEKDLSERAKGGPWKNQAWIGKIKEASAKIRSAQKCPEAPPKFVYWELLRKDTGEGSREVYTIDVLLAVKKADFKDALFFALNALKASEGKPVEGFVKEVAESLNEAAEEDVAPPAP
jgi:hypothetical protein